MLELVLVLLLVLVFDQVLVLVVLVNLVLVVVVVVVVVVEEMVGMAVFLISTEFLTKSVFLSNIVAVLDGLG